jgi:uncharacterized OB-fold protein
VPLQGRVYSWTRTWHDFGGLERLDKPFVIAVVQLDGGGNARLLGMVEGNAEVAIGDLVTGAIAETPWGEASVPAIRWRRA